MLPKQSRPVFMPGPFRQSIDYVEHTHAIEDMAGRTEGFRYSWGVAKVEQGREGEPHIPPFVCDRRAAQSATHLAGQGSLVAIARAAKKAQVVDACNESNISFMEDRRPLHWGAVQRLAVATVADFGVYRVGANLVRDGTTLAFGTVTGSKTAIVG